jgi:hypothetical protein
VVAGPYLSYHALATLVARVSGRPYRIVTLPDATRPPLLRVARALDQWGQGRFGEISSAAVAGGFLRLHASGKRADVAFGLEHPSPIASVYDALEYARRQGLAPRITLRVPAAEMASPAL